MTGDQQIRLEDINEEYAAFVDKFKPKKTTDDCYTPEEKKGEKMFKKFKKWLKAKIREIKDRRIIRLGGHTHSELDDYIELCDALEAEAEKALNLSKVSADFADDLIRQIRFAQSEIAIEPKYGYTRENIIEASKAQTMFKLGQEIYKYANHSITNDGTYLCTVTVMHMDVNDKIKVLYAGLSEL